MALALSWTSFSVFGSDNGPTLLLLLSFPVLKWPTHASSGSGFESVGTVSEFVDKA